MICRKVFFLAGLTLCVSLCSFSQTVISARNGSWNDPATWVGGTVPFAVNSSLIRIDHDVSLESGSIETYSLEIRGSLSIANGASLKVLSIDGINGYLQVQGQFLVEGSLIGVDGVKYFTSVANTRFLPASYFRLQGGPKAYIPIAQWDLSSTFLVEGFRNSGYVALAYSDGWKQAFGNVVYNCAAQTTFVDLNGHLKDVRGSLRIENTNGNALRFATTQKTTITVAGDFRVEGNSEVWLNTTADSLRFNVGGNFVYNSNSTGPSYLTTRGKTVLSVGGTLSMNSSGPLRLCSGSVDSTGVRRSIFRLSGGMQVTRGSFIAPSPGRGVIIFSGAQSQMVSVSAPSFSGNFEYHIEPAAIVDLGTGAIGGTGKIFIKGHLKLGSGSSSGPLDPAFGNVRTIGERIFYPSSTIEYNGDVDQFVTASHPSSSSINVILNNGKQLQILKDILANHLTVLKGTIVTNDHTLKVQGNLVFDPSVLINGKSAVTFAGPATQTASFSNARIHRIILEKNSGDVQLLNPVNVIEQVNIKTIGTRLHSNGNLRLLSLNDSASGSAFVAPLPDGASIEGDVSVERFMSGEGRVYRYISSPVEDETVAGLMDDFPVTGLFNDPSTGKGLNSRGPSLYYFDDSDVLSSGWIPYPTAGRAAENILIPGRGYAAYIRRDSKPTTWDVTGRLNQGSIELRVQFTAESSDELRGWSLVGNPYACAIEWGKDEGWERSADLAATIAVRDNATGVFHYSDGEVGDIPSGRIAAGQSFWVRATAIYPRLVVNEQAKASEGGEFFRQASEPVDHIVITMKGPGVHDNVFIRKRKGASRKNDLLDGVKKLNAGLSFSVLSDDGMALAICALDTFNCQERFQLKMTFAEIPGVSDSYTISLLPFGLFSTSIIRIKDQFTGNLIDSFPYNFSVTSDSRSMDPYRFILFIENDLSVAGNPVTALPYNCRDSVFALACADNQHYYASLWNNRFEVQDSLHNIIIPSAKFKENAPNTIYVMRESLCSTVKLDSIVLNKESPPTPPEVTSLYRCANDSISIACRESRGKLAYHWFRGDTLIATTFKPNILLPHKVENIWAVALSTSSGCVSDRTIINEPMDKDDFLIVKGEDGLLHSDRDSYWFLEGKLLRSDSLNFVRPLKNGMYTAKMRIGECNIESTFFYERETEPGIYPNPFNDELTIQFSSDKDDAILAVYNLEGKRMISIGGNKNELKIETTEWPKGIYVAEINSATKRFRIKIVK